MPSRGAIEATDYWVPLFVFAIFTAAEGYAPVSLYPWLYVCKVCAITAALAMFSGGLSDIKPTRRVALPAVAVGVVVFAEWVLLDKWIPYPHLGTRVGFDPFASVQDQRLLVTFLTARFYGLVVLVPTIEELFWRSFLLRYATNPDFRSLPIGAFSTGAFWLVALASAASHPEWLVAVVASCLFAWLLRSTRSLFATIVAHATANAALGMFIVIRHEWQYW